MVDDKKNKVIDREEQLTRRTIQLIGFGTMALLGAIRIVTTIVGIDAGIPWQVILVFAGLGASGSINIDLSFLRRDK